LASVLFDGTHASIADIAKSENINPSFVSQHPAAGLLVAGDHRGDSEWPISGALDHEAPDRAVSDGMGEAGGTFLC